MPVPESEVLKPVEPWITNSDDWEIFVLSDARVVYENNGKPASLLAAFADTPLKVTGRLETPARPQLKYLVKKPYKPEEIELRNVSRFAYGEMEDQTFVVWAQGNAGWFEIRPAAAYKAIFKDMIIAVELLYFVTDIYSEPRKKGGGPSAQLVFQEYAEDERFVCSDAAAAEAIFDKHHIFLMLSFFGRAQGINWSNTSLYQHFKRKFPKEFETCKARAEGRDTVTQQTEKTTRTTKSASAPATDVQTKKSNLEVRGSRGKAVAMSKSTDAPKKDDNWWEAAALFEFMQKAVNQRAVRSGRNQITLDKISELIVKRYEIEETEIAKHVLLVHAQNLCYMMDHPRRKSIRYFAEEPIYQELVAGHNLSAAEQRRAEGVELRPRRDHATLRYGDSDSSDVSDLDDDVATPIRPPRRRNQGRLSVLRPKSGKFSGKRQGKSIKGGFGESTTSGSSDSSSQEEDSEKIDGSEDGMSIDTPTQALSPGGGKRKLDAANAAEDESKDRRKRAASDSATPKSPSSMEESEEDDGQATTGKLPLPLRNNNGTKPSKSGKKPAVRMTLVSTPLPTYEPNGPRDSWICSFDGCSQRIYGCSKERGRELITEHLEDHTKGTEKAVGILWREQDKLNLPVGNLIKKIREMSDSTTPLFPSTTVMQPQPIQRSD